MASTVRISGISSVSVRSHYFPSNLEKRFYCKRPLFQPAAAALTSDSMESNVSSNRVSPGVKVEREIASGFWNGFSNPDASEEKGERGYRDGKLDPLWNDGYGDETVKEYFDNAEDLIRPDGGPPRWFTPLSCGPHLKDSPVLLYLPGIDGLGLGLILHHKALGKVFDVWCMHIPVHDQTPFQDLVKRVEETVRAEHSLSPNKPIYLVGDSVGGCLALAVAARNPRIDLVLILANPATSFGTSRLQPLSPWFNTLPDELHTAVPYLLSFVIGDPVKMAVVDIDKLLPPMQFLELLSGNLNDLLPRLSGLADIIPKETLLWKLKLLRNGAAYANSRLHSVKAEVLVLASGKDNLFPSRDEAQRLKTTLQNCKVRYFKDHGHSLLLEDGIHLLMIIKGTGMYRHSKSYDCVMDFLPPSVSEFEQEQNRLIRKFVGPVILSTLQDGKIVRGLKGVPNEGPVLYVGYHMLMGIELAPLAEHFLLEKKIVIRGLAQPAVFSDLLEGQDQEFSFFDTMRLYGAVAVTPSNFFKLMKAKSHVLLYPGGAREALHSKGEEYKLFWPDEPEFVRMAARFGATIVPFGSVGEDDIAEIVMDHDEQLEIPLWRDSLINRREKFEPFNVRAGKTGEVAKQLRFLPLIRPKLPGRFYYLFGEPIQTKGQEEVLEDRQKASELYLHIKSQVEAKIAYLLKKREQDPYRGIVDRTVYRAFHSPMDRVPTFKPE